ncbi:hypothetical protein EV421DRAFT_1852684 [Armillaria borealis]|uniref:Uncharacterized protein n=1 Tax=Armillaria borealis TaxID=47425 RepID=A0AA39IWF3_9AGAR|nr:hypothetical protein EV421DRAFT_1852684 [Armillaria borealis]
MLIKTIKKFRARKRTSMEREFLIGQVVVCSSEGLVASEGHEHVARVHHQHTTGSRSHTKCLGGVSTQGSDASIRVQQISRAYLTDGARNMSNINIANKKWNILLDRAFPSRLRVNILECPRIQTSESSGQRILEASAARCFSSHISTECSFDEISAIFRHALILDRQVASSKNRRYSSQSSGPHIPNRPGVIWV